MLSRLSHGFAFGNALRPAYQIGQAWLNEAKTPAQWKPSPCRPTWTMALCYDTSCSVVMLCYDFGMLCCNTYPPTPLGRRPEVRLASASVPLPPSSKLKGRWRQRDPQCRFAQEEAQPLNDPKQAHLVAYSVSENISQIDSLVLSSRLHSSEVACAHVHCSSGQVELTPPQPHPAPPGMHAQPLRNATQPHSAPLSPTRPQTPPQPHHSPTRPHSAPPTPPHSTPSSLREG